MVYKSKSSFEYSLHWSFSYHEGSRTRKYKQALIRNSNSFHFVIFVMVLPKSVPEIWVQPGLFSSVQWDEVEMLPWPYGIGHILTTSVLQASRDTPGDVQDLLLKIKPRWLPPNCCTISQAQKFNLKRNVIQLKKKRKWSSVFTYLGI